jgi:hypothetical protein
MIRHERAGALWAVLIMCALMWAAGPLAKEQEANGRAETVVKTRHSADSPAG